MPRVKRGTRDVNGTETYKQPAGGTGRLRCMKCPGVAAPVALPNGKTVMRCGGCGTQYAVTAMDKAEKTKPLRVGVPGARRDPR